MTKKGLASVSTAGAKPLHALFIKKSDVLQRKMCKRLFDAPGAPCQFKIEA
jgi:hypothetical protein